MQLLGPPGAHEFTMSHPVSHHVSRHVYTMLRQFAALRTVSWLKVRLGLLSPGSPGARRAMQDRKIHDDCSEILRPHARICCKAIGCSWVKRLSCRSEFLGGRGEALWRKGGLIFVHFFESTLLPTEAAQIEAQVCQLFGPSTTKPAALEEPKAEADAEGLEPDTQ